MTEREIGTILNRLDDIATDVTEIKTQVKVTNGRVTSLELWRARWEGSTAAVKWLPGLATAVIGGSIGAVVAYLLS